MKCKIANYEKMKAKVKKKRYQPGKQRVTKTNVQNRKTRQAKGETTKKIKRSRTKNPVPAFFVR